MSGHDITACGKMQRWSKKRQGMTLVVPQLQKMKAGFSP
jgi:hypothetical protein